MVKPWLLLPPSLSQHMGHWFLKSVRPFQAPKRNSWASYQWRGLNFANPLGVAGGVDKDADLIESWWCYGAGFVEIGTVTPRAQSPNPGTILMRDVRHQALWNKMGFPSKGVDHVAANLRKLKRPFHTPIFANVGKNRETPLEDAAKDYIHCIQKLQGLADVFVINISSPNTANLRELQKPEGLRDFLEPIRKADPKTPLLIKLAPDLGQEVLFSILDVSVQCGLDGWVLTNTTIDRPDGLNFPKEGGMSGRPLSNTSKRILLKAVEHLKATNALENRLLVSCGGAMSADDVDERLKLGANLVQVYSALIFEGPNFFNRVAKAHDGN